MLRREARLRKEYLYRKSLEEKEQGIQDQKLRLKVALDTNAPIPVDLREDASKLTQELSYDDGTSF